MHKELYHGESEPSRLTVAMGSPKLHTIKDHSPNFSPTLSPVSYETGNNLKLPTRTSSATKLFSKLKARICKSKTMFSHPEEVNDHVLTSHKMSMHSDCTSKALKVESMMGSPLATCYEDLQKESYKCHLCPFVADRITVLDRHLLNDHKIGIENLLKLVLVKTKDSLSEDLEPILGIQQPYYKPLDEIIEDGEFIIETVTPKIKILKHNSTNTDLTLIDKPNVVDTTDNNDNWKGIIDNMMTITKENGNVDMMNKIKALNDYMSRFVASSNMLKRVFDSKANVRPDFQLGLGDRGTPREWEGKAHSETMERRSKYPDNSRVDKVKMSSESFYY